MVRIPTTEQIGEEWLRGSVQAYLDGEQNLTWVLGLVRGQEATAVRLLLARFRGYVGSPRYEQLREHLMPPA